MPLPRPVPAWESAAQWSEVVWCLRRCDGELAARIQRTLGFSPITARILASRHLSSLESVESFLRAPLAALRSPFQMKGMDAAVRRIIRALEAEERIRVFGDYDVDGQTSTATTTLFLRAVGARVDFVVADRLRDGYGVSEPVVREAARDGVTLLLTCDSGITALGPIGLARELGIDTVVVDHHRAPPQLPAAVAILNPAQPGCGFPFKGLCAAGVAFYLAAGVRQRLRELGRSGLPDLRELLDIVAIGTIGDVVPLVDENRALVRHGLRRIAERRRPGIRALLEVASVRSDSAPSIPASTIAFRIAPRLNAAGRMGDARRSVELLVTDDAAEARRLAATLDADNTRRREVEQENLREALESAMAMSEPDGQPPPALVLASGSWHQGVVGIVAQRLVDRFARPVAVVALTAEGGRGSIRAPAGFSAYAALQDASEHLTRWGGHAAAAGFSIEPGQIDAFREAFAAAAREQLGRGRPTTELRYDVEVSLADVDRRLCEELTSLEPFGAGNPEPLLVVRSAQAIAQRVVKEKHLRLRLDDGTARRGAIAFGHGHRHPIGAAQRLDVAFHAELNSWNGRTEVSLRVRELKASEAEADSGEPPLASVASDVG